MDVQEQKIFEDALRALGVSRLRLDQVVSAYQRAFPTAAMKPDMRQDIRDAVVVLVESGVLSVPEGEDIHDENPVALPNVVEFCEAAGAPALGAVPALGAA